MQIILFIIIAYLLYRFVTGFVLPVITAASRVKKQFRDMQATQSRASGAGNAEPQKPASVKTAMQRTTSGKKAPKEDYIEFEEIPSSKRF